MTEDALTEDAPIDLDERLRAVKAAARANGRNRMLLAAGVATALVIYLHRRVSGRAWGPTAGHRARERARGRPPDRRTPQS